MKLLATLCLIALPAIGQVRGVVTVGAGDLTELGFAGLAATAGLGVEYTTPGAFYEASGDVSPARKMDAASTVSVTASADVWKRFGPADRRQILLGGGYAYSYTDAVAYQKTAHRYRVGFGMARTTPWGALRGTISWLQPLSDPNRLHGLEATARADVGHLRLGASVAGYQFNGPLVTGGPTRTARVYGATLGWVF